MSRRHVARRTGLFLAVSLIAALFWFAPGALPAAAQAEQPSPTPVISDDQVNAIARDMYCPICDNIPLDVCPTAACADWREQIRTKLAEGWDRKQIEDFFAVRFSDRVLSLPPARGLNLLLYIFPPLAILTGAWVVISALRRMRRPQKPGGAAKPAVPAQGDDYIKRVEEELRRREREG